MTTLLAVIAAAASFPCNLPRGWDGVEVRRTRFIVFGESHGTGEQPAFVERIACALARRGERVLVAIEQDAVDDGALQHAWAEPGSLFSAALRRYPGWAGRDDGVGSRAMFDLLVGLHRLRTVNVAAFNGERDEAQHTRFAHLPNQGPHEAAQAENIRDAATRGRYDRVLVLIGASHARKQVIAERGEPYEAMVRRLAPARDVTSLRLVPGPGEAWSCQLRKGVTLAPGQPPPTGAVVCGAFPSGGKPERGSAPAVRMGVTPPGEAAGDYDGYVWIGPVTASPPVDPGAGR